MKEARRKIINLGRDFPELTSAILEYENAVNKIISKMENESFKNELAISNLLKENKLYLQIMASYGIDLNKLGTRPIGSILSSIDFASRGIYLIPEKLKPFIQIRYDL